MTPEPLFPPIGDAPGWYVMLDVPLDEDADEPDAPVITDCPVPREKETVWHAGRAYRVADVIWHLTPDPDADPDALFTPWAQVVLQR